MMSSLAGTDSGSRTSAAVVALIPPTVGAAVHILLSRALGSEESQSYGKLVEAAAAVAVLFVGVPLARQAVQRDEERAVQRAQSNVHSSGVSTPSSPRLIVPPSASTIALAAVLGAATFWLLDLLTSILGFGSLQFFGGQLPFGREETYQALAIRAVPLLLIGVFPIAVWTGHRLRDRTQMALNSAVVLFVIAILGTNLLFAELSEPPDLTAADIYIPILEGCLTYIVCLLGSRYAARTQHRFDIMRAARLQSERTSRGSQ
jgi:hypothetical protein